MEEPATVPRPGVRSYVGAVGGRRRVNVRIGRYAVLRVCERQPLRSERARTADSRHGGRAGIGSNVQGEAAADLGISTDRDFLSPTHWADGVKLSYRDFSRWERRKELLCPKEVSVLRFLS